MSATAARWPKATGENPCVVCGHTHSCKNAPDGTAAACWHDGNGGKVIQLAHVNGNGSNGHHAPSKPTIKPGKVSFCTLAEATEAARRLAEKNNAQAATLGLQSIYRSADDEPRDLMVVLRFDLAGGGKQILPLKPTKGGGWAIGDPPEPLPLYRQPELADGDPIFLTEGEKPALAAASIGLTSTTSSHGAGSAARTDWRPLAGRSVVILPDHDEPGEGYARDACRLLLKLNPPARVRIVRLPGLPDGGDIVEFIQARRPADNDTIREEIEALAEAAPIVDASDVLGGPLLVCMESVQPRAVQWLWAGRIPLGRITLLVGKPGEGKSFLTTDLAARVTTGTPWPDGSDCPAGSVILISAEDDPADTIRPRLDANRADCRRVHHLSMVRRIDDEGKKFDAMFTLADLPALETALKSRPDCQLIIIDPIGSFLGTGTDAHRDNEVRGVLAPVAKLAEKYGPAVLVIAHRRKGNSGGNADELALGSRAFTGIARAVWHLSRDPQNKSRRLLLPGKNNLAPEGTGLAFTIGGNPASISWERDAVDLSADDGLAAENDAADNSKPGPEPDALNAARKWLAGLLASGEVPAAKVRSESKDAGMAWRTVQRAADALGIIREKNAFSGGWQWRFPKPGTEDAKSTCQVSPNTDNLAPWHLGKNQRKEEVASRLSAEDATSICVGEEPGTFGDESGVDE